MKDSAPGALDMVVKAEQQAKLGTCLAELEEKTSQAIRSAFLDGMTYEQLAERMSVPLGTMKSWIRRGLLKLTGLSRSSMSDDIDHTTPEDEGRLTAAEYVLGVLTTEERRAIETRLALEPALARDVAYWEERLGGMASFVKPVTPPTRTWLRIEAALSAPPPSAGRRASSWGSASFWQGLGVGASAMAAACLAALVFFGDRHASATTAATARAAARHLERHPDQAAEFRRRPSAPTAPA